jgi:hypothetical protein
MSKHAKLLERILLGSSDAHILFDGLCHLLRRYGFNNGFAAASAFSRDGSEEILNLQPRGADAKS